MAHIVDKIQDALNFKGCVNKQFSKNGIGKIGTTGFVVGAVGGIHFGMLITIIVLSSSIKYTQFIQSIVSVVEL